MSYKTNLILHLVLHLVPKGATLKAKLLLSNIIELSKLCSLFLSYSFASNLYLLLKHDRIKLVLLTHDHVED